MKIQFYKYHGAGNDFILIDNRSDHFPKGDKQLVTQLCQRHFGIGSDGLMLLENDLNTDFKMVFLNPDGSLFPIICGNGGRCMVAFARDLNLIDSKTVFAAADGVHHAEIEGDIVKLQMRNVHEIKEEQGALSLNTGAPHHVAFFEDIRNINVFSEGKKIRETLYGEEGANVNFATSHQDGSLSIRSYERGVEVETLSCGTGAIAAVIAAFEKGYISKSVMTVHTRGADLRVRFTKTGRGYEDIFLIGPTRFVFKGEWPMSHLSKDS